MSKKKDSNLNKKINDFDKHKAKDINTVNILMWAICIITVAYIGISVFNLYLTKEKNQSETYKIFTDDISSFLNTKDLKYVNSIIDDKVDITIENFLATGKEVSPIRLSGVNISNKSIRDIDGPVVIDVVADWCEFCQEETREHLNNIIEQHPDVTIIQYIISGGEAEKDALYANANATQNPNLIIAYNDETFKSWLKSELQLEYLPGKIFVGSDNIIKLTYTGLMDEDMFTKYCNLAFGEKDPANFTTVDGYSLQEGFARSDYALQYINSLTEITIPSEK